MQNTAKADIIREVMLGTNRRQLSYNHSKTNMTTLFTTWLKSQSMTPFQKPMNELQSDSAVVFPLMGPKDS